MGRTYKVGSAGSFGARYGTVARKRYATVVTGLRAPHECPQCHLLSVKRLSVGIWLCRSCGFKFAGGAYVPTTKLGQIAERASRAGVASALLAELKAQKARTEGKKPKAKAPRKRRRAVTKKTEEPAKTEAPEAPSAAAASEGTHK
jgi:large subunit ribosomal protein L37Ae